MIGEDWQRAFATVAALSGMGGAIDFWIGKQGQRRVRDQLETWWLRFSYVRVTNFGREEALFAIQVLDGLLGDRLLSRRRLTSVLVIGAVMLTVWVIAPAVLASFYGVSFADQTASIAEIRILLVEFFPNLALLAVSISLTRFIAMRAAAILAFFPSLTIVVLSASVILQYMIFCYTVDDVQVLLQFIFGRIFFSIDTSLSDAIRTARFLDFLASGYNPTLFPFHMRLHAVFINNQVFSIHAHEESFKYNRELLIRAMALLPNFGRISLMAVFVTSYLLKPLYHSFSIFWMRVVESDKPVFTLVFGGGAALIEAIDKVLENI